MGKFAIILGVLCLIGGIIWFFMQGSIPTPFKISSLNNNQNLGMIIAIAGLFFVVIGILPRRVRARYPDGTVSYS